MKEIYVGTNSYKVIVKDCNKVLPATKYFDFENQRDINTYGTLTFQKEMLKYSASVDKMIALFRKMKKFYQYATKARKQAEYIKETLEKYENDEFKKDLVEVRLYNAGTLQQKNNLQYLEYLKKLEKADVEIRDENANEKKWIRNFPY